MLNFLFATNFAVEDFEGSYFLCDEHAAEVQLVDGTHKSDELGEQTGSQSQSKSERGKTTSTRAGRLTQCQS